MFLLETPDVWVPRNIVPPRSLLVCMASSAWYDFVNHIGCACLGCPWSFGVDAFSLGCVIAEIHLSDTLVPSASTTDQERLATVEKLVGPFPEDYAQSIEDRFPDTFAFEDTMAVVIYPPTDESISEPDHIAALRRLEQIRPISVRIHIRIVVNFAS